MPANPKVEQEKVTFVCNSCQSELRRKPTEPTPRSCNYCHTDTPSFTVKP